MNRPTTSELTDALDDIYAIAYAHDPNGSPRNNTGFRDVATLLNLFASIDGEIKRQGYPAALGPGVEGGYHVLQHGGEPSDLDARTHDAHIKALRNLRAGWLVELGRMVDSMREDAMDVGRWPTRKEQAAG